MKSLRAVPALMACLMVAACVLGSEHPRFDDAAAQLMLGDQPVTFTLYHREADGWKAAQDPTVMMIPEQGHYRMPDPEEPQNPIAALIHFVPLDAGHWLMQMSVPQGHSPINAYYSVATWDGQELLSAPITCDDLQDRPGVADLVTFTEDNCVLSPLAPGQTADFPAILWQDLPPPSTRLVKQP